MIGGTQMNREEREGVGEGVSFLDRINRIQWIKRISPERKILSILRVSAKNAKRRQKVFYSPF